MKEKGIAIAKERLDKLQENLSNISGFLFDRTNGVLQNGKQITIEKYDQILLIMSDILLNQTKRLGSY